MRSGTERKNGVWKLEFLSTTIDYRREKDRGRHVLLWRKRPWTTVLFTMERGVECACGGCCLRR